ncbi:hypothetical protein NMY22_g3490 [Coprinellus aureogranulatus]|nr:hypothetical protein NMY22_g3490 [Coprinellus aureogranulatus]
MLAEHNWIYVALHLLFGSANLQVQLSPNQERRTIDVAHGIPRPEPEHIVLRPLQRILFFDPQSAHDIWVSVLPAVRVSPSRREQADVTNHMIKLLSKDYHIRYQAGIASPECHSNESNPSGWHLRALL